MEEMNLGRILVFTGLAIAALGALLLLAGRMNLPLGRLPGDIVWRSRNTTVYFPWLTCLVLSIIVTLLLWAINRRP